MGLLEQLRALDQTHPGRTTPLPLRPSTERFPVTWLDADDAEAWDGYPELEDVEGQLVAYVPLADVALREDEHRCLLVARAAPHAVFVFEDGFHELAPSLEAFLAGLEGDSPRAPAAPPPTPAQVAAARRDAIAAALAARTWASARALIEEALSGFQTHEELTELRAAYARVLAELRDEVAGRDLAVAHVDWLAWLARSDHAQASALQARFVEILDGTTIGAEGGAVVLGAIRAGISAPLAAPTPVAVSAANIDMAIRMIRAGKAPGLRSLLAKVPQVLDVAEVQAALAELPASSKADEVRAVIAELRR